jgi:hypoxanthine phosphoribosyltransferase
MSSASACLPILKSALAKGGAIPGRLVGDMLVVEETASSVRLRAVVVEGMV